LRRVCGYHLAKPTPDLERVGQGRALLTLPAYGGLRVGEALALRWRDVRLHAAPRRLDVLDAKTSAGVREVHLSPELADILARYRQASAHRAARAQTGQALLWASRDGAQRSRTWALANVRRAAEAQARCVRAANSRPCRT
jgi:integrase